MQTRGDFNLKSITWLPSGLLRVYLSPSLTPGQPLTSLGLKQFEVPFSTYVFPALQYRRAENRAYLIIFDNRFSGQSFFAHSRYRVVRNSRHPGFASSHYLGQDLPRLLLLL